MKTLSTVMTAATLAIASASALAAGPCDYGQDASYPYYGYAPYGFQAAQPTEEQQKAMAEQHAKMIENMQAQQARMIEDMQARQAQMFQDMEKARQQAAEYQASQPAPTFGAYPADFQGESFPGGFEDPFMRHMEAVHEAHIRQMDAHAESLGLVDPAMSGPFEDAYSREMDAEREARIKEMETRREESRKAAEARRQESMERFKARRLERTGQVDEKTGA